MSEDRKGLTFAELLDWHIKNNTRPAPVSRHVRWTLTSFAEAVKVDDRLLRYWRDGTVPNNESREKIELALFGDTPDHDQFRAEFRRAYDLANESDKLLDTLGDEKGLVERLMRRRAVYNEIWKRLSQPEDTHLLVLFGGIASSLCDAEAATRYSTWLSGNANARLFVCYESGLGAQSRASRLNPLSIPEDSPLPLDTEDRMIAKEQGVLALRNTLTTSLPEITAEKRVQFVPLQYPLTTYVMVADDQVFLTPIFDVRSSISLSIALAKKKSVNFRHDVYRHMIYHLKILERSQESDALLDVLNAKLSERHS